ncbi:MAG: DUF4238 domain-containing protein [Roseiarcus sp.]
MTGDQDHHYVPIFFQKAWCDARGKLMVYSRKNGRVVASPLAPLSTGYEPNLYSLDKTLPKYKHYIETQFMTPKIDTPAATVVKKIREGSFESLTSADRSDFARFLLSLRARHPDAVELAKNKGRDELLKHLARDPEEYTAVKGDAAATTLVEWTQQKLPQLVENFGLWNLPALIVNDTIAKRVWAMPWGIRDVRGATVDLLLSDRPCLIQGSAVEGECLIILPVSPSLLFFACNQSKIIVQMRTAEPTPLVKRVNKISVSSAAARVFGTGNQHLALVEKCLAA